MPAVQLAQLKRQIDKLIWHFTRPRDFCIALHDLLGLYSNRGVYRPGRTVQPMRQINTYYTSPIILREIQKELKRQVAENPDAALVLADALWNEDFSEFRYLSAYILGLAPVSSPSPILQRLGLWVQSSDQAFPLSDLLDLGTVRLRREAAPVYLEMISDWISSSSIKLNKIGLEALLSLVKDEQFIDLPKVFSLISPMIKRVSLPLQGELRQLMIELINRSPSETAYFLRQIVLISPNTETKRLLRKVLDDLPDHLRGKLRDLVNNPDFTL
jgi:hypothetical protein